MTSRTRRPQLGRARLALPARAALPAPGQIDLWLLDVTPDQVVLAQGLVETTPILDDTARAWADRVVHPRLRDGHLVAQVALRLVVSRYLDTRPGRPALTRASCAMCGQPHGRQVLAGDEPLHFSVAHVHGLAACAVASSPVGFQMTDLHTVPWHAVDPLLHPAERVVVDRVPADRRPLAALSCWVRKDAYLRGSDLGLDVSPASVYVGPGPAFAPGEPVRAATPPGWGVLPISIPGVLAAAALALPQQCSAPQLHARHTDLARLLPTAPQQPYPAGSSDWPVLPGRLGFTADSAAS